MPKTGSPVNSRTGRTPWRNKPPRQAKNWMSWRRGWRSAIPAATIPRRAHCWRNWSTTPRDHARVHWPSKSCRGWKHPAAKAHRIFARRCEAGATLNRRHDDAQALSVACRERAEMDLTFLWDKQREQFAIGYDVERDKRDAARYDLLASEARILSYVAISQGQVPPSHWFKLGR